MDRDHPQVAWAIRHQLITWGVVDDVAKESVNPNLELLERTLEAVRHEAHSSDGRWTQSAWRCDSGMCFAGWAAHLAGAAWAVEWDGNRDTSLRGDFVSVLTPQGDVMPVWKFAEEVLRLGEWDSHALFDPVNTLEDIELICDSIRNKATAAKVSTNKAEKAAS